MLLQLLKALSGTQRLKQFPLGETKKIPLEVYHLQGQLLPIPGPR